MIPDWLKQSISIKMFSGRFIAINLIVFTYCGIIAATLILVHGKIIPWDAFVAVFGPFALTAKDVIHNYFEREDRTTPIEPIKEVKP